MTDEERQKVNDTIHDDLQKRIGNLETRATKIETRLAEKDTQFALSIPSFQQYSGVLALPGLRLLAC